MMKMLAAINIAFTGELGPIDAMRSDFEDSIDERRTSMIPAERRAREAARAQEEMREFDDAYQAADKAGGWQQVTPPEGYGITIR